MEMITRIKTRREKETSDCFEAIFNHGRVILVLRCPVLGIDTHCTCGTRRGTKRPLVAGMVDRVDLAW